MTRSLEATYTARFAEMSETSRVRNRPEVNHTKGSVYVLSEGSRKRHKEEHCFDTIRLYKTVELFTRFSASSLSVLLLVLLLKIDVVVDRY